MNEELREQVAEYLVNNDADEVINKVLDALSTEVNKLKSGVSNITQWDNALTEVDKIIDNLRGNDDTNDN